MEAKCIFGYRNECPIRKELQKIVKDYYMDQAPFSAIISIYTTLALFCQSCPWRQYTRKREEVRVEKEPKGEVKELNAEIDKIKDEYGDVLDVVRGTTYIMIMPRKYLGDVWKEINEKLKKLGFEWKRGIKASESYWILPLK